MVRPANFAFNPETATTNSFQAKNTLLTEREIRLRARKEFDLMAERLRMAGVDLLIIEDREAPAVPDAVFPNNWISFHHDGTVVLYPMYSPLRRLERRRDIVEYLSTQGYKVSRIVDLTHHEREGRFLEGTGSIVFDHVERCAYANLSPRTDAEVLGQLCDALDYSRITFRSVDARGQAIYHTNVMMCIGAQFAVLCSESIPNSVERKLVVESLQATGREIINIDYNQLEHFAGNILQLQAKDGGSVIAMSTQACLAFRADQRAVIEKYGRIVESPLPLIEGIEGGSARCMLAEVHLPR
jgi:hypothetical protein